MNVKLLRWLKKKKQSFLRIQGPRCVKKKHFSNFSCGFLCSVTSRLKIFFVLPSVSIDKTRKTEVWFSFFGFGCFFFCLDQQNQEIFQTEKRKKKEYKRNMVIKKAVPQAETAGFSLCVIFFFLISFSIHMYICMYKYFSSICNIIYNFTAVPHSSHPFLASAPTASK